jgi:hypothetical protein
MNFKVTAADPFSDAKLMKILSKYRYQTDHRFGLAIEQDQYLLAVS